MLEKRCRLCAERRDDLIALLDEVDLSGKIYSLFQIQVEAEDKLPTSVCLLCRDTVNNIWEFNKRVQKAQAILCDEDNDDLLQISQSDNECMFKNDEMETGRSKRSFTRKKTATAKVCLVKFSLVLFYCFSKYCVVDIG